MVFKNLVGKVIPLLKPFGKNVKRLERLPPKNPSD